MATSNLSSSGRRKLALIIGNDNYARPQNRLNHSTSNARELSNLLRTIGFDVKTASDSDKQQMNTHITNFPKTIGDGNLILIYFSGHGYQVNDKNYLIPVGDAQIESNRDVEDFAIDVEKMLERLVKTNPSYVTILILDCCRSYLLNNASASSSVAESKGLHEMKPPSRTFIQFACAANQTVTNDLFTKHLLRHIAQENVNITDIFQRIANDVSQESKNKQRPLSMNALSRHEQVYLNEVIVPIVEPPREWDDINKNDLKSILKKQEELRGYYDNFPDVDDIADRNRPDVRKAEELTRSILSEVPSGNAAEKDTACHIINSLLGGGDQQCLFFDSTQGMNLHDASRNLVDLNFQDRPLVLKLNSSTGLGNNKYVTGAEYDLQIIQTLSHSIEQKRSHPLLDDIIERLSEAHNSNKKDIVLKGMYSGSFSIVYTVMDLTKNISKKLIGMSEKLKSQFKQFKAAKIHPLLYRPSFDISQFDVRGNKDFSSTAQSFEVGPPGRTKLYTQPIGWTRYGLKVLGDYPTDYWLHPFGDPRNWYRAYHGTGNASATDFGKSDASFDKQYASIDAAASIHQTGFRPARIDAYGAGVYCSPDPTFPEKKYVGTVPLNTQYGKKFFKCMLQVAVNPDGVKFATNEIWVVQQSENIRAYGILIKETKQNRSKVPTYDD